MISQIYTDNMGSSLLLRWLALEVKYLDRAVSFYRRHLDLPVVREESHEVALSAGETDLILRRPTRTPRGGIHTHYAFSTPKSKYADWWDRLSQEFDLTEVEFGTAKSLYFYDTEGNCVEIGQSADTGNGITGVFEVVLEVESLPRAESFYTQLGFEVTDRGTDRQRTRLTAGSFDLELWEPQLGLADARGGVHVDIGIETNDPTERVERVRSQTTAVEPLEHGIRVKDPECHYLTLV